MTEYEYDFDEGVHLTPDDLWEHYGFAPHIAQQWINYGFDDPKEADEWSSAVGHPDIAVFMIERNVKPARARVWSELIDRHGGDFPLEEAYDAAEGSATLATAYARHFPVEEWSSLRAVRVPERATAQVARLSGSIDARDHDKGMDESRSRSIWEAARWLGDYSDVTPGRVSLVQNMIFLGKAPDDVPFVLMDMGNDKAGEVSARQAALADGWLKEAGYEANESGLAAYRLIVRLDAHPKHMGLLIRRFGVQRVVSALETGLDTLPQLQHHLKHGGVAEIARGVL